MAHLSMSDIIPDEQIHQNFRLNEFYLYRSSENGITYLFNKNKELLMILGDKYLLPHHFLNADPFAHDRVVVRSVSHVSGKFYYGLSDLHGNLIMPCKFEEISHGILGEKYIIMAEQGSYFIADMDGNRISAEEYDEVNNTRDWYHHGHYLKVRIEGRMGLLNHELKEIIPLKYRDIIIFTREKTGFNEDEARLIDFSGNVIKYYLERGKSKKIKNKFIKQFYFNFF